MDKPLVSIITPSFNQGRFIRETIESVLTQDYDNIEYIIVDGGSSDSSLDIIREYSGKLTLITEKDNGQSDAINKGFKLAHGEIVAWLNSDDVYEKGCVSIAVKEMQKNSRLSFVYGKGYIIDESSIKKGVFEHTQEFDLWKLTNFWDYIMQPATFMRMSYLKQVGFLDINLNYCMDWDLWIKLANVGQVKYIHECLACSREYSSTKTSTGGKKRLDEIKNLLIKYSGTPKPLGFYSYKVSTLYLRYADKKIKSKILALYMGLVHLILNSLMPTRSKDGWIPKKYELCIPGYCTSFLIIIADESFSYVRSITVRVDNCVTYEYDIKDRKIRINLPNTGHIHKIIIESKALKKYLLKRKKLLKIENIIYDDSLM